MRRNACDRRGGRHGRRISPGTARNRGANTQAVAAACGDGGGQVNPVMICGLRSEG